MGICIKKSDGRLILLYFVAFFALIVAVNGIFIYSALSSYSGVVTENPYEKGLAFNKMLDKAEAQIGVENKASYEGDILRWHLPVEGAHVTATIMRAVQEGYDFNVELSHVGDGVYESKLVMPLHGAWSAKLKATWNNQDLLTNLDFIAK